MEIQPSSAPPQAPVNNTSRADEDRQARESERKAAEDAAIERQEAERAAADRRRSDRQVDIEA